MMQKLPYKDFKFQGNHFADSNAPLRRSLADYINTPDDSLYGYYTVCDIGYNDICKKTDQLPPTPNKIKRKTIMN